MKFRVRHLTVYKYTEPVPLSHHAVHLSPREVPGQVVKDAKVAICPIPAVQSEVQSDYFGNPTFYFTIQDPHATLGVEATFEVETNPPPPLAQLDGTAWDKVRSELRRANRTALLEAQDYLFASPLVPMLPEAQD